MIVHNVCHAFDLGYLDLGSLNLGSLGLNFLHLKLGFDLIGIPGVFLLQRRKMVLLDD